MKLNRRKLKSLIAEEIRKLNEAPDESLMQEVLEALKNLPEPYTVNIAGDKIVCSTPTGPEAEDEVAFEVIFK